MENDKVMKRLFKKKKTPKRYGACLNKYIIPGIAVLHEHVALDEVLMAVLTLKNTALICSKLTGRSLLSCAY